MTTLHLRKTSPEEITTNEVAPNQGILRTPGGNERKEGKDFESSMLGTLTQENIVASFSMVLEETYKIWKITDADEELAISRTLFKDGAKKGSRKWSSVDDLKMSFVKKMRTGDDGEIARAYYDFNEFLELIKRNKKSDVPTFYDRDVEHNTSLRIAEMTNGSTSETVFSKSIVQEIKSQIPNLTIKVINGLGTPMDYIQKIDFVVAVLNDKGKIVRYYAYDLTLNDEKEESKMEEIVIINPKNLNATGFVRTRECIDKVVQDVVERERSAQ